MSSDNASSVVYEYLLPDLQELSVRLEHRSLPLVRMITTLEASSTGCCVPSKKNLHVTAKVLNMTNLVAVCLPEGCYILETLVFKWVFISANDSMKQWLFARTTLFGEPQLVYLTLHDGNRVHVRLFSREGNLMQSDMIICGETDDLSCDTLGPNNLVINKTTVPLNCHEEISRSPAPQVYPEGEVDRLLFVLRENSAAAAFEVFDFETVALAQHISMVDFGLKEEISRFLKHISSTLLDLPHPNPNTVKMKLTCHPDLEIGSRLPIRKDRLIESVMSKIFCLVRDSTDLWPFYVCAQRDPRWSLRLLPLGWGLKQSQSLVLQLGAFESPEAFIFIGRKNIPLIKSLREKVTLSGESTNFQVDDDPEYRKYQEAVKQIVHGENCGYRNYLARLVSSLPKKKFPGPPIFIGKKLFTPNRLRTIISRTNL